MLGTKIGFDCEWAGESTLICPHCGYNCLHQGTVEVFDRNEDAKNGMHAVVTSSPFHSPIQQNTAVTVDTSMRNNPSPRRDGILIRFYCEGCQHTSILQITQHKGQTFVAWAE